MTTNTCTGSGRRSPPAGVACVPLLVLLAGLAGCAGFGGQPEPGLYAERGEQLQRMDGEREWEQETWPERSSLDPNTAFLVRNPRLQDAGSSLQDHVRLYRVAWVRSEITRQGDIRPVDGTQWVDATIEPLRVALELEYADEDRTTVRARPRSELEPGLYTLQVRDDTGQAQARLGVDWPDADRRAYAAAQCVDRYAGQSPAYRPCSEQRQAAADHSLKVHLVAPEIARQPGQAPELVIKGVVVNTSERPRRLPMLRARLESDDGEALRDWLFEARARELEAGGSAPFESRLPNPPQAAGNVHVSVSSVEPDAGRTRR